MNVAIGILAERREGTGRVLISSRSRDGVLGGFLGAAGGQDRVPGECPRMSSAGVRRGSRAGHPGGGAIAGHKDRYEHGRVYLHPFFCSRVGGEPRDIQVAEHRWVTGEELARFRFPASE